MYLLPSLCLHTFISLRNHLVGILASQMRTERHKNVSKDPTSHSKEANQNGNPEKNNNEAPHNNS